MRKSTRTTAVVVGIVMPIVIAVAGCSGQETEPVDSAPAESQPEASQPDESSGGGSVSVVINGTESTGDFGTPSCTDMGEEYGNTTVISAGTLSSGDAGLMVNVGGSSGLTASLTAPETNGTEVMSYSEEVVANFDGTTLTLTGPMGDDPYAPEIEVDVAIEVTC